MSVERGAPVGGLHILKARFGSARAARWIDVSPKLNQLVASGAIRITSVRLGVFGRDPAPDVIKTLEVEYELSGKMQTVTIA